MSVAAGRGPVALQIVVLGAVFILLGLCSDSMYAVVAGTIGGRLRERARARAGQRRRQWSGVALIGLGLVAAMTRRPAPAT